MSVRIIIAMLLIFSGLFVAAVSILGLFRFRDALEKIHAGALIDTLVVLLILSGLVVLCGFSVHTLKIIILLVLLWTTNPVSAHLIARMELITGRNIDPDAKTGEGEEQL